MQLLCKLRTPADKALFPVIVVQLEVMGAAKWHAGGQGCRDEPSDYIHQTRNTRTARTRIILYPVMAAVQKCSAADCLARVRRLLQIQIRFISVVARRLKITGNQIQNAAATRVVRVGTSHSTA